MSVRLVDYFSTDYSEARGKFLDACSEGNTPVRSFPNPGLGPSGEPLYTDVTCLGARDAKSILVLGSGTHGVEGFCGAGIQTGLLREGLASCLKDDQSIVIIHAINPYGFAHLRRANEDNIDLNRNFIDHTKPHPQNPDYDALFDAINPRLDTRLNRLLADNQLLWALARRGRRALKVAIAKGQYSHAKGLFFGGEVESWSNRTVRGIVQEYLAHAARVVFIDFHTGLGSHGHGQIITRFRPGSGTYERIAGWWGNRAKSAAASKTATDNLSGAITVAMSEMLPTAEVTPVTLEFGTVGQLRILRAMQLENWVHHHGRAAHPLFAQAKAEMKRVYYPETDSWKLQIWEQANDFMDAALVGLNGEHA